MAHITYFITISSHRGPESQMLPEAAVTVFCEALSGQSLIPFLKLILGFRV